MATPAELAALLGAELAESTVRMPDIGFECRLPIYRWKARKVSDRERVKTYNKGESAKLDDGNGYPTFAELIVISRLRSSGWDAGWANNARDPAVLIQGWAADAVEPIRTETPESVRGLIRLIQEEAGRFARQVAGLDEAALGGGVLDVIAWRGNEVRFIECKHQGAWRDDLQKSQKLWIAGALAANVPAEHLGVFEWSFTAP